MQVLMSWPYKHIAAAHDHENLDSGLVVPGGITDRQPGQVSSVATAGGCWVHVRRKGGKMRVQVVVFEDPWNTHFFSRPAARYADGALGFTWAYVVSGSRGNKVQATKWKVDFLVGYTVTKTKSFFSSPQVHAAGDGWLGCDVSVISCNSTGVMKRSDYLLGRYGLLFYVHLQPVLPRSHYRYFSCREKMPNACGTLFSCYISTFFGHPSVALKGDPCALTRSKHRSPWTIATAIGNKGL